MKLRKGDEVIIATGKDKGKMGKVERVLIKGDSVIVPGVSEYKRHTKARMQGQQSEIVTITKPIAISKVALMCPKCHKRTRIGFKQDKDKKVRICKKCDAII